MGKEKKEKKDKTPSKNKVNDDDEGGELRPVCAIAKPLADIGFHKKILKVVKKGARKTQPPPPAPQGIGRPRSPDVLHTDVQSIPSIEYSLQAQAGEARREGGCEGAPQGHQGVSARDAINPNT